MFSINISAAKTPTFVVSSEKGNAGDTVKITVSTQDNVGVISMKVLLKYDSKALKVVDCEGGAFSSVAFSPKQSNPFIINWIQPLDSDNKTNGKLATITFKILDTAPNGKSELTLSYNPNDVFNSKMENVTFAVENGYVDITNSNPPQNTTTDSSAQDDSSDVMIDTTASDILQQAQNSVNQGGTQSDVSDATTSTNDWIIWLVVAAILVLGGAFSFVIIKNKKTHK